MGPSTCNLLAFSHTSIASRSHSQHSARTTHRSTYHVSTSRKGLGPKGYAGLGSRRGDGVPDIESASAYASQVVRIPGFFFYCKHRVWPWPRPQLHHRLRRERAIQRALPGVLALIRRILRLAYRSISRMAQGSGDLHDGIFLWACYCWCQRMPCLYPWPFTRMVTSTMGLFEASSTREWPLPLHSHVYLGLAFSYLDPPDLTTPNSTLGVLKTNVRFYTIGTTFTNRSLENAADLCNCVIVQLCSD